MRTEDLGSVPELSGSRGMAGWWGLELVAEEEGHPPKTSIHSHETLGIVCKCSGGQGLGLPR